MILPKGTKFITNQNTTWWEQGIKGEIIGHSEDCSEENSYYYAKLENSHSQWSIKREWFDLVEEEPKISITLPDNKEVWF